MNPSEKRTMKDISSMLQDTQFIGDYGVQIHSDTLSEVIISFKGPADTPFAGGRFKIKLDMPINYPYEPPVVEFITRIFHPNISKGGLVCVDTLKSKWRPVMGIVQVILTVLELLRSPNPASPLNIPAGYMMEGDMDMYSRTVTMWVYAFAEGTNPDPAYMRLIETLGDMGLGGTNPDRIVSLTKARWCVDDVIQNLLCKRALQQLSSTDELPDVDL